MDENVRALLAMMDPPREGGDACDWEAIAAGTGWRFPADYRELIEAFGSGEIVGGVSFGSPPRRGDPLDSGILRSRPSSTDTDLLMWGGSDAGESYYWRCGESDPGQWTVAVRSGSHMLDFQMGAAEFLVKMLTGQLGESLGIDMSRGRHTFVGWREAKRILLEGIAADGFDD